MADEIRVDFQLDRPSGTLLIVGPLTKETVRRAEILLSNLSRNEIAAIDLGRVSTFDQVGVALIRREIDRRGLGLENVVNAEEPLRDELGRMPEEVSKIPRRGTHQKGLAGLNERLAEGLDLLGRYLLLAADLIGWSVVALGSKRYYKRGAVAEQCFRIGANAVPVLSVLSLVLGLILALQSAAQLQQVGASAFVADLLAIAVIREMAPMMTAILLAGRTGSAITSEIGTMRVTEEIDALRVMGIQPLRYVMVPMFLGGSIVMPFLVAIAIVMSALGGMITAVTMLNVSALGFLDRLVNAISGFEVFTTFLKSEVFMWCIVSIGCHYGMQVRGGAQEIGRATTTSVVSSIFSVILVDVLFSLIAL